MNAADETEVLARRQVRRFRSARLTFRSMGRAPQTFPITQPIVRIGSQPGNDLVLEDEAVSRIHLELAADADGVRARDLGSRNGTFVDGVRAFDLYLRPGASVVIGRSELLFEQLSDEVEVSESAAERFGPLLGVSPPMRALFHVLERAAKVDVTVLVEGETGTGKELVARALHQAGPRARGPFVVFDCAAVAPNLMESQLFGHDKGAFTGAITRRVGAAEEAHRGTLALDELGELPLDLQPKLLRALEAREVIPLGTSRPVRVDARVVAATNRDLASEVNRGTFRADLYHRLAVIRVVVPPLRDRPDDIRMLVRHFVEDSLQGDQELASSVFTAIPGEAWRTLESYPFPGNVRELRNIVERSIALREPGAKFSFELGPGGPSFAPERPAASRTRPLAVDLDRPFIEQKAEIVAAFEEAYVMGLLERHKGNLSRAAAAAGIDRMYFKRIMKRCGGG